MGVDADTNTIFNCPIREHLRRSHTKPRFLCHRCQDVFKTGTELTGHLQQTIACDKKQPPREEEIRFMNEDQRELLRKMPIKKGIDEKVRWLALFRLLFGDVPDDNLPSPCELRLQITGTWRC